MISLGEARDLDSKRMFRYELPVSSFANGAYIVGRSRSGKTNLIEGMLDQFIDRGIPFTFLDREGGTTEYLISLIAQNFTPEEAAERFVFVDFTDDWILPLNFLAPDRFHNPETVVSEIVSALAGIWTSAYDVGVRMEAMQTTGFALCSALGLSVAQFLDIVNDKDLARYLSTLCANELGRDFYANYRGGLSDYLFRSWIESSINKITPLIRSPFLGPPLQAKGCVDFSTHMDAGRSVIVTLDERRLGRDSRLAAALILAKYDLDSRKREEGAPFHVLVIDEAQEYACTALEPLLSRRQKRGLSVVLAHQDSAQLDPDLISVILANTKIHVAFSLGHMETARLMAKQVFPLGARLDRQGRPFGVATEIELFARELYEQKLGEAVVSLVSEGRVSWLWSEKRWPYRMSEDKALAMLQASKARHLDSRTAVQAEQKRRREFLDAARKKAKTARRRRPGGSA